MCLGTVNSLQSKCSPETLSLGGGHKFKANSFGLNVEDLSICALCIMCPAANNMVKISTENDLDSITNTWF